MLSLMFIMSARAQIFSSRLDFCPLNSGRGADEAQDRERGGGELLQRRGQRRPAERHAAGVLRARVQALQGTINQVRMHKDAVKPSETMFRL